VLPQRGRVLLPGGAERGALVPLRHGQRADARQQHRERGPPPAHRAQCLPRKALAGVPVLPPRGPAPQPRPVSPAPPRGAGARAPVTAVPPARRRERTARRASGARVPSAHARPDAPWPHAAPDPSQARRRCCRGGSRQRAAAHTPAGCQRCRQLPPPGHSLADALRRSSMQGARHERRPSGPPSLEAGQHQRPGRRTCSGWTLCCGKGVRAAASMPASASRAAASDAWPACAAPRLSAPAMEWSCKTAARGVTAGRVRAGTTVGACRQPAPKRSQARQRQHADPAPPPRAEHGRRLGARQARAQPQGRRRGRGRLRQGRRRADGLLCRQCAVAGRRCHRALAGRQQRARQPLLQLLTLPAARACCTSAPELLAERRSAQRAAAAQRTLWQRRRRLCTRAAAPGNPSGPAGAPSLLPWPRSACAASGPGCG